MPYPMTFETGDLDEHTYTEIIDVLRQYGADSQSDIEELWRRVAFFILINVESLMSISACCRIELPKAKSILGSVTQAVGRWRERGREIGMTDVELDQTH
jgi:serine/threonine-protein kinase HipA